MDNWTTIPPKLTLRLNTITPLLSIIVTSYTTQRTRDILDLLDSITKQTYPNIETVFVIERSDELVKKITTYANNISLTNLKVIFNTGEQGASAARNQESKPPKAP